MVGAFALRVGSGIALASDDMVHVFEEVYRLRRLVTYFCRGPKSEHGTCVCTCPVLSSRLVFGMCSFEKMAKKRPTIC